MTQNSNIIGRDDGCPIFGGFARVRMNGQTMFVKLHDQTKTLPDGTVVMTGVRVNKDGTDFGASFVRDDGVAVDPVHLLMFTPESLKAHMGLNTKFGLLQKV